LLGGYVLRKFYLLASILPLFGCNNFDLTPKNVSAKEPSYSQTNTMATPLANYENYHILLLQAIEKSINQPVTESTTRNPIRISPKKQETLLDVTVINQNPELKYGCEVTSLAMVLHYAGVKTDKMELYRLIQKEDYPLIRKSNGDILHWGNPENGFVGDMTGRLAGTTVYDKPMIHLINQKLPGRAVNLTNQPFEKIEEHVSAGYPIVVWTTLDYGLPKRWVAWNHGHQVVRVPFDLHAVVLVGYDNNFVYLNDPLTIKKQVKVEKEQFVSSWKALGSRAVSYE
jgi:uncharacterized protein YvpB